MRPKHYTREDIVRAHKMTRSGRAAARFLGCSYQHYRKFAKLYIDEETGKSLFDLQKNQSGKGIPKFLSGKGKEAQNTPIKDIIEGRVPIEHFSPEKIKLKLIAEGYLEEKCSRCEFCERRVVDYKIPLLLGFKDGNRKNYSLGNIELLCYNCYFLWIGDVFNSKQLQGIEDYVIPTAAYEPDWELDDHYLQHFKDIGLIDDKEDGEEYISKI
jgi:hypothetical protein